MRNLILGVVILGICLSCSKDEPHPGNEFIGTYRFMGTHTHLVQFTDSITNTFIEVTDTIDRSISISTIEKDSVNIDGLLKDGQTVIVKGGIAGKNLQMNFKMNDALSVDELIGEVRFTTDSAFLTYRWRKGQTWSPAFPLYGNISASAKR